ncbi:MAG: hypothetical protein M3Z23_00495 [Acidobacteriota bacterium]|nr:hypothetical protein [Acidobacteriota bacterium]
MKTFDELTEEEQDRIFESIDGTDTVPDCEMRDGTHYEYDPGLKSVVEFTPQGERFVVSFRDGALVRLRDLDKPPGSNLNAA